MSVSQSVSEKQPIQQKQRSRPIARILWLAILLLVIGAIIYLSNYYAPNRPVDYADDAAHFKYGSTGTDIESGLPLKIMRVLPRMFPEYLPEGTTAQDFTAFGMIQEPGQPMPIGFSIRRYYIDRTNANCAVCHVGSVRASEDSEPQIILGMPANTVDFFGFFEFIFAAAGDWRFTPEHIIPEMEKDEKLGPLEKQIYKLAIPFLQGQLLTRRYKLAFLFEPDQPRFGPGRVDTFNSFKFDHFAEYYHGVEISKSERIGIVDFPAIWNQRPKEGMQLHWDGNNDSVHERNFSAAFAAGATRERIDIERMVRVEEWLMDLAVPQYPFEIDESKLARGEQIYQQYCFDCHDFDGAKVGTVVPLEEIKTDRHRLDSYTEKLREAQTAYTAGYDFAFTHFRKTDGYANMPLDGIWARAPYLHNGSVPNMWDLLLSEDLRTEQFYIGDDVYDPDRMGFRHDAPSTNGRKLFLLNTQVLGNGNQGHSGEIYGTELADDDKYALIEYLKTQ